MMIEKYKMFQSADELGKLGAQLIAHENWMKKFYPTST